MKDFITQWFRRKSRPATRAAAQAAAYFTVLFDPEGRLMVCEDGVWKVFELDRRGRVRASARGRGCDAASAL